MTAAELKAIGNARFGTEWQTALARAIGISSRHMRRLAAGEAPIGDGIAHDIQSALGIGSLESLAWPRDEWILGDGGEDSEREYLIHAHPPRFIARVVEVDEDGDHDSDADLLTGVTFTAADDMTTLCEIVWLDPTPPDTQLQELLAAAAKHIMAT